MGCLSSLAFTMWFGFGQTAARNFAKIQSALEYSPLLKEWTTTTKALLKPVSTDQCPADWWRDIDGEKISIFDETKINSTLEALEGNYPENSTATYALFSN